jgi:hypothetical protein
VVRAGEISGSQIGKCQSAAGPRAVRPGNAGRYTVDGPGYFNWDAGILKNFNLGSEKFNNSTLFGEISSYRAARRMQIAAKFTF